MDHKKLNFYYPVLMLLGLLGICGPRVWAAAPPSEPILIIYYADNNQTCADGSAFTAADNYSVLLEQAFVTALNALPAPPTITLLAIHAGDSGIYSELHSQLGLTNLDSFCQVYDLRFLDECNNQGYTNGETSPDVVTLTGANSDEDLYQQYLAAGGSLFLQGEHHDFYQRDNNLLQLVNSMASVPVVSTLCTTNICADVNTGNPVTFTNPFTANYGFDTNYNNLSGATSLIGVFVGGIPSADYGSGLPLITVTGLSYSAGSGGMMMGWEGGALNAPYSAGKLIANFETNAFVGGTGITTIWAAEAIQNAYTMLSGCLRYTITKTFNPTTVCVGNNGSFTICATNTSALVSITNASISDTIPTCLQYLSSTESVAPSATGNAANLYWWTFANLAPGASACVTVQYTAENMTCP